MSIGVWKLYAVFFYINEINEKELKVNSNIMQSGIPNVGSYTREPSKARERMAGFIRCILGFTTPKTQPLWFGKCPSDTANQGITSQDVFANYEAFSTRQPGEESTLEKLAVVVAFGSGILLICFSVLVVF
jgi:hypothetical protein